MSEPTVATIDERQWTKDDDSSIVSGVLKSLAPLMPELKAHPGAMTTRGHRAIGVVYNPARERGNYVPTVLPRRYHAFLAIEEAQALHPLHLHPDQTQPPQLYPWGL